jgi:ATP-dependent Clp protease ATP-binding subunit ClpC
VFFGPIALALHATVLGIFVLGILAVEHEIAFVEASLLYLFTLGVLHRFVMEVLLAEEPSPDLVGAVGADLLSHIRHPGSVTFTDLLEAALVSPRGAFVLAELGISAQEMRDATQALRESDPRNLLESARQQLSKFQAKSIAAPHILSALLGVSEGPARDALNRADLSIEDLDCIIEWESLHAASRRTSGACSPASLQKSFGGMGRSWVMGYNRILDELTEDLTSQALSHAPRGTVLHQKETETISGVLTRSVNHNALILGRRGAGRWTMLLSYTAALRERELASGSPLSRVLLLKTQRLLSGTDHPDHDFLKALQHRDAGRYIIVIRDLGLLLSGGDARLVGVLMKLLESPNVSVIAIADTEEYHKAIAAHPGVDVLFERVLLEEISEKETTQVLMEEYFALQRSAHVTVPYRALRAIIAGTDRYVGTAAFPGKAIDVLREVVAAARTIKPPVVTEAMVLKAVSVRAHQDVSAVGVTDREAYLHLEDALRSHIIGQDEAMHVLADALKRGKMQLGSRKRPIGTFLLLGPTGVGKTETAKGLAEIVFGGSDRMIRLDMNEFSESASVVEIIGGGTGDKGVLTRQIQERPSSLILLDELEKAHPHVLNLFLQILDEGHLIDSDGVKTDFRSAIILATSNAGSIAVQKIVGANPGIASADFRKQLIDAIVTAGTYTPEFLNRFDEVIVFKPLALPDAIAIATQMIGSIVEAMQKGKGITLKIDADVLEAIATKGYSVEFGARAMRRAVQDTLETHLADRFLRESPKRGEVITVTRGDLRI